MRLVGIFALCAVSSGCFVPKKLGDQMQADIAELRKELRQAQANLETQQVVLQEQIERAKSQAKVIADKIQDLNRATKKAGADSYVQLAELRRLVQELTGQQELLSYELSQLQKGLDRLPDNDNKPAEKLPSDKAELLAHGKKLLKSGEKEEARGVFRQILKKWGKSQGIADDALFQLGESYYQEQKYAAALQEYIKVVERFGKGKFVDDAYYRIGLCSMKMGNLEDAQIFFKEVIKNYPKSPMASYARKKLKEVQNKLAKERG